MEEFLKKIGITNEGKLQDGVYTINLESFDDVGRLHSKLEKAQASGILDETEGNSITLRIIDLTYVTADENATHKYEINLSGDMDEDIYQLVVTEF